MASQPVVDTLKVANEMEGRGMDREQAQGLAQVLGDELGERVVVHKDLDRVHSEIANTRTDLNASIKGVRSEVDKVRTNLDAKIDVLRAEMTGRLDGVNSRLTMLTVALPLILAGLALLDRMDLGWRTGPPATPPAVAAPTITAPPVAAAPVAAPLAAPVPRASPTPEPTPTN